jgi:hypothetical protein
MPKRKRKRLGTISLGERTPPGSGSVISGIISLLFSVLYYSEFISRPITFLSSLITGIIAVIFGFVALFGKNKCIYGIVGLILGFLSLVLMGMR